MIEIRRILCPIDFSDASRHALQHAVAIARWYESRLTALHVFSAAPSAAAYAPGMAYESLVLSRTDRDQLLAHLKSFVATSAGDVPVDAVLREGATASGILGQAAEMKADLLVLGTHGRSGFERLLLGSVTEKVLRKAPSPVLTVPTRGSEPEPADTVAFKRILCPVDFSGPSMVALNHAMSLAQESDAHLTVVHVLAHDLEAPPALLETYRVDLTDFRRKVEEHAQDQLQKAIPDAVRAYCSVETMLLEGKPGPTILRLAGEQQSDLIVMGVQGRGMADVMLFGSTTNLVVRGASCPVLTLKRG